MHITKLRKIGGSVMLVVPPALLDTLQLETGAQVGITVEGGRLIVESRRRHHYPLEELLAQCNPRSPRTTEEREWLDPTERHKQKRQRPVLIVSPDIMDDVLAKLATIFE